MASILRATSKVSSWAFKPSSEGAEHVKQKLEHLNKEHADRTDEEIA